MNSLMPSLNATWQQGRMTWTEQEAGVWTCILRTSPRRAWLSLSMCLETALRRPHVIRHAFTLALMHKHFYEYVRDTSRELETVICDLREWEPAALGATAVEPQYR